MRPRLAYTLVAPYRLWAPRRQIRVSALRRMGARPLLLGAWLTAGGTSLCLVLFVA
jgi:hypothetical protein